MWVTMLSSVSKGNGSGDDLLHCRSYFSDGCPSDMSCLAHPRLTAFADPQIGVFNWLLMG